MNELPDATKFPAPPVWGTYDVRKYGNSRMARFRTHSTLSHAKRSIYAKGSGLLYEFCEGKWVLRDAIFPNETQNGTKVK